MPAEAKFLFKKLPPDAKYSGGPGQTSVNRATKTDPPDAHLVVRTLRGDERAFATLYGRHYPLVARRLRRVLRNQDDVEEVLQMTFVEAHKNLARFRVDGSFIAWLQGIAFRQAYNYLRKMRRRRWLGLDSLQLEARRDPSASLEERTIQRELLGVLYAALDALPANKRIALGLYALEGLGFTEIGQLVGASPQTVRARVLSARAAVLKEFRRVTGQRPSAGIAEQLV